MPYTPSEWAENHTRAANANRAAARNNLMAHAAKPDATWRTAVELANDLAEAEGRVAAAILVTGLAIGMENGLTLVDALVRINEHVASVARDDGWSGRGNEGRRAYRDGFIEVTSAFASAISREAVTR